jgi:ketosteroid isomerase-like protein
MISNVELCHAGGPWSSFLSFPSPLHAAEPQDPCVAARPCPQRARHHRQPRLGPLHLFSHQEDITLGNPFGPYSRGRKNVEATLDGAAGHYRDGEVTGVELVATYATSELSCVVEVERGRAKVGGNSEVVAIAVRVTSVFRNEQGEWRLVHRHADPITTPRPAASVVSK